MIPFSISSIAIIILQFDGSLRPPRDPQPGFTYSSKVIGSGILDGSEKLASCGASISLSDGGDDDEKLIALCSKYIPNEISMTSADTEYDGLLLGLDYLINELSSHQSNFYELMGNTNDTKLIIRGDCKAVIDQINYKSIPRKMESKYNLAMEKINSIKELYSTYHQRNNDVSLSDANGVLSICLEHISREYNTLCDAICKIVINHKQAEFVASILELIQLGEEDTINKIDEGSTKQKHTKKKRKKHIMHSKSKYFQQAFDSICNNPQLCHSSRLALACKLTRVSIRFKDSANLDGLSNFFMDMSRRLNKFYYAEDNDDNDMIRDTLRRASILCKKSSTHFTDNTQLGDDSKACNGVVDSIFQFYVGSKSSDITDEKDMNTAILDLYKDISEIISSVEVESYRNELILWSVEDT